MKVTGLQMRLSLGLRLLYTVSNRYLTNAFQKEEKIMIVIKYSNFKFVSLI